MGDPAKKRTTRYRLKSGAADDSDAIYDLTDTQAKDFLDIARQTGAAYEVLDDNDQPTGPVDSPRVSPEIGKVTIGEAQFDGPDSPEPAPKRAPRPTTTIGQMEIVGRDPRYNAHIGEAQFDPEPYPQPRSAREPHPVLDTIAGALEPLEAPLTQARDSFIEPLARGFNKSLLMGGGDEAGAALAALTTDASLQDALAQERAMDEYDANAHPVPMGMGRALGFLPGMVAAPATYLGRGLMGALSGAAGGALSSDSNDVEQTLRDAGQGSLWGAGLTAGGELLSNYLGPLLRRIGVGMRRSSAAPGTAEDLNAIREREGIDYMEHGLDDAFDEQGLASYPWLQSAADVAKRIGPPAGGTGPRMLQAAGNQLGDAVDTAQAMGVRGDWNNVDDTLRGGAQRVLDSMPAPALPQRQDAAELTRIRGELPGRMQQLQRNGQPLPPREAPPRDLQRQKVGFQKAGKYPKGVPLPPPDQRQANSYRQAAGAVAGELDDTMQAAGPELHSQFTKGNKAYQDLSMFGEMAGEQAVRNQQRAPYRDPAMYAAGATGAGAGALLSERLGIGAIPGAVLGGLGGARAGQAYGLDLAGAGTMLGGNALTELGGVAQAAAGRVGPQSTFGEPDVTEAALQAVGANKEALGPYSEQFIQAAASPNPSAASALILRLIQTDPEFRMYVLPMLRAGAVQR